MRALPVFVVVLGLAMPAVAVPLTFVVSTTTDLVDTTPGNGVVDEVGGGIALRAAVMEANAHVGADTITLPAGTYTLTIPRGGEAVSAAGNDDFRGDLDINESLTINGAGASTTIIDGNSLDRIFQIHAGTLTLTGVTLTHGSTLGGGGAVWNFGGTLIMSNCNIIANGTTDTNASNGGAVGGGLKTDGICTITNCTFANNTVNDANNPSGVSDGAGILNNSTVTLTNCTFFNNACQGIAADSRGGAIFNNAGAMTLLNCTIASNTCLGLGGGIFKQGGTVTVKNTIIDSNVGGNCNGMIGTTGHNIESANDCNLTGVGDLPLTNAKVAALADNGGAVQTCALMKGSPAINVGDNSGAPGTDARGVTRPIGPTVDVGAFEASLVDVDVNMSVTGGPFVVGSTAHLSAVVTNNGPSSATGVSLSVTIPAGATVLSSATTVGTIAGSAPVVATIGNLASGGTAMITIDIRVANTGTSNATATVTANETDVSPGNDSISSPISVSPAPDADSDGVPDATDNCPNVANANQADTDADGVGDACDNCPNVANADQADANTNGTGDACEDRDGDGIPDVSDNCPDVANADQADADANGTGDACETQGMSHSASGCGGCAPIGLFTYGSMAALAFVVTRRRRSR